MQAAANPASFLLIIAFVALLCVAVGSLAAVPAYILWRMTKDKRYPLAWVTCCSLVVLIAAGLTYLQRPYLLPPTPINETLADVVDGTGALRVTALRLPHPELLDASFEVDVENASDADHFLGIQYSADGGAVNGFSPGTTSSHHIWTVPPRTKTTLTAAIQLPGFVQGGNISVVLARCTQSKGDGIWLPDDSDAFYQERFTIVPSETANPAESPAL